MAINIGPRAGGTYNVPTYSGIGQAGQALGGAFSRVAQRNHQEQMQEQQAADALIRLLQQEVGKDARQESAIGAQAQAAVVKQEQAALALQEKRDHEARLLGEKRDHEAAVLAEGRGYDSRNELPQDEQNRILSFLAQNTDQEEIRQFGADNPALFGDEQARGAYERAVPAATQPRELEIQGFQRVIDDPNSSPAERQAAQRSLETTHLENIHPTELGAVEGATAKAEQLSELADIAYGPDPPPGAKTALRILSQELFGRPQERQATQLAAYESARHATDALIHSIETVGIPTNPLSKDYADQQQYVSQIILSGAELMSRGANFTLMEKLLTGKITGVDGLDSLKGRVWQALREDPEDVIPRIKDFMKFAGKIERSIVQPGFVAPSLAQEALDSQFRNLTPEVLDQMLVDPQASAEDKAAIMRIRENR